jgi:ribosomal protein S18 acetylase RimI-like enzyme
VNGQALIFADLALARRLEAADAWFKASYVEAQARLRPQLGATVEAVAGGYAVYAGPGSPLNRAVGLGMEGPVGAQALERVERFFDRRGALARIDVCPLADPSLVEELNRRNYHLAEFKNVWARPLRGDEGLTPLVAGVQVRAARPEEAALWIRTVSQGFAGRDAVTPEDQEIAAPNFFLPTAACFLAWIEGKVAGGGALATHQGLAAFFSASTRPAFRGRGVQTALLQARLAAAAAAGCDLALVHTTPGNASQRNVQRAGFCLAYTKLALCQR